MKRTAPEGQIIAGYSFAYEFDASGNRKTSVVNSREEEYVTNERNEYLQPTVPGNIDLRGHLAGDAAAIANSIVGIGSEVVPMADGKFAKSLTVENNSVPVWKKLEILGVKRKTNPQDPDQIQVTNGHLYIAKTPEIFSYDDDGNLVGDGRWHYYWDGENRLVKLETIASALDAGAPNIIRSFLYDADSQCTRVDSVVTSGNETSITHRWVRQNSSVAVQRRTTAVLNLAKAESMYRTNSTSSSSGR